MGEVMINVGAGPVSSSGDGWTNTIETARKSASDWLATMRAEGVGDVELLPEAEEVDGRWRFTFRHRVTGVEVVLEIHGIDDLKAYERERTFHPRIYWNDSTTAEPRLEDFAAPGFRMVKTFASAAVRDV